MARSEMYATIKENGWASEFQAKYGKNFTQGKTTELETFIAEHSKGSNIDAHIQEGVSCEGKKVRETILKDIEKPKNFNAVKAIIKMITVLQSEAVITAEEAQEVLEELNEE